MIDWGVPRKTKAKALRIHCVNNLKQIAESFRAWHGGSRGGFPMQAPGTNGNALAWSEGGIALRHFLAMSNELTTPKILTCPSDTRTATTNFGNVKNENLSYFVGLEARETHPQMCLYGDRNITNGLSPVHSVLLLPPDRPAGWTAAMHVKLGNVALSDGSVASFSTASLRGALENTGDMTNRLALPE